MYFQPKMYFLTILVNLGCFGPRNFFGGLIFGLENDQATL